MPKPMVFVSCGQFKDEEKALGKAVCNLIETETPYDAYFAEQQSTFDGLVNNILAALGRASALVAIMHHRGVIDTPSGRVTRGSVWIEQEVAIGAFIHHVVKRPLHVALYLQRGISLEGARQQLLLGPTIFDHATEVLDDLRRRVGTWNLSIAGRKSLIAQWRWTHRGEPQTHRHEYRLDVDLVNNGIEKVEEWKAEIWFPADYIEGVRNKDVVYEWESDTNYTPEYRRIWPGDEPRRAFFIDYYIDNKNAPNRTPWLGEDRPERYVRIRVSGGDQPWEEMIPMSKLHNF